MKRIGIDFGTSTTLIAYRESDSSVPRIIPIGKGAFPWIPSVVRRYEPLGLAEDYENLGSEKVLESPKSGLTDLSLFTKRDLNNKDVTREEIESAVKIIISETIARAKAQIPDLFLEAKVFMGCPALWSGANRRIIADVADSLGLDVDVMSVIDEPVAAGVQWIHSQWIKNDAYLNGRVLVFDAGGGTLDVALLEVQGSEAPDITVLSADSLAKSGDELDFSIVRFLCDRDVELKNTVRIDTLKQVAKRLKESLSDVDEATQIVDTDPPKLLRLTQEDLEVIAKQQVDESMDLVKRVLKMGKLRFMPIDPVAIRKLPISDLAREVQYVVLVGGLSKLKSFRNALKSIFKDSNFFQVDNPQQTVAEGLTYGDVMKSLNMPRPPINFYVSSKNLEKPLLVYEAFSSLYSDTDVILGRSYLSHKVFLKEYKNGRFAFHCEWPDRNRTRIKFDIDGKVVSELVFKQDLRSVDGEVTFFLYATGEICFHGYQCISEVRVTKWPAMEGSTDLSQNSLSLKEKKYVDSYDEVDKSSSSRK